MRKFKVKVKVDDVYVCNGHKEADITLDQSQVAELVKQYNTKESSDKYFFPGNNEQYYFLRDEGSVQRYDFQNEDDNDPLRVAMGVFKEEVDAEKARDRQQALVQMDKWCQENGIDTNVDWKDGNQAKYSPRYYHRNQKWDVSNSYAYQMQFHIPYFKSEEDCTKFIEANINHLNKLL